MAALTATVSGIFCLACPGIVQGIITVLFGVYIVVDSASALSESLECARVHQKGWVCMLILSLITAIMGVFVMFFSTFDFVMVFAGSVAHRRGRAPSRNHAYVLVSYPRGKTSGPQTRRGRVRSQVNVKVNKIGSGGSFVCGSPFFLLKKLAKRGIIVIILTYAEEI